MPEENIDEVPFEKVTKGNSPRLWFGDQSSWSTVRKMFVAIVIWNVVTALTIATALLVWRIRISLILIGLGGFVAIVLNPAVGYLSPRFMRRSIAVSIVFFSAAIVFVSLGYVFIHPVYQSANHFAVSFPTLVKDASHGKGPVGKIVQQLHLEQWAQRNQPKIKSTLSSLEKPALKLGRTVAQAIIEAATVIVIAFFMLLQGPGLFNSLERFMDKARFTRLKRVSGEVSKAVTGYVVGDFLTSVIAGVIVFIALALTGVPYAAVMAIWVGLVDFLPLVGGLLAGVPIVVVSTLHSVPAGIVVLVVFLLYQQVENHVLYPIIMSKTTRLNPLWVLLAVLMGADTGGILGNTPGAVVGAVVAIPFAGAIQVIAHEIWQPNPKKDSEETEKVEKNSEMLHE